MQVRSRSLCVCRAEEPVCLVSPAWVRRVQQHSDQGLALEQAGPVLPMELPAKGNPAQPHLPGSARPEA